MLGTVKAQKSSTLADKIASNILGSWRDHKYYYTVLSVSKFPITKHKLEILYLCVGRVMSWFRNGTTQLSALFPQDSPKPDTAHLLSPAFPSHFLLCGWSWELEAQNVKIMC